MPFHALRERFGKRPSESLAEKAYQMLMDRLLANKLSPGTFINRRELARELKMSVAPVLEAIVQLQAEGFLESIPRKGTLVCTVDFHSLRGQLLLREALECAAARYYCGSPIVTNYSALKKMAHEADVAERKTFVQLWKAEAAFHFSLILLTECEALIDAYRKVMERKLFASINLLLGGEAFSGGNHVALLKGLQTKDPDLAERLIREHLRFNKERLFRGPQLEALEWPVDLGGRQTAPER